MYYSFVPLCIYIHYIYVCVYVHPWVCACINVCMCIDTCVWLYAYVYIYVYACLYAYAYMYMSMYVGMYISALVWVYMCLWLSVCIHMYLFLCNIADILQSCHLIPSNERKGQTCNYSLVPMFINVLIIQANHLREFPNCFHAKQETLHFFLKGGF